MLLLNMKVIAMTSVYQNLYCVEYMWIITEIKGEIKWVIVHTNRQNSLFKQTGTTQSAYIISLS